MFSASIRALPVPGVSHTGKLYNLLAERVAARITDELEGVEEAYGYLLSRIGAPVSEPQLADIGLRLADPAMLDALRPRAAKIVRAELRAAPQLWRELIAFAPDQRTDRPGGHTF